MGQTLRHTIRTYEPRLQNVQIVHVPSEGLDLTLRFSINARVVVDGSKRAIQFETLLDASRRVTVR
jgi:type VI secretion system lysozyme-like protein